MQSLMKSILLLLLLNAAGSAFAEDPVTAGKAALQKKSYDEAIGYFQNALKSNARSVEVNYYLGEAYRLKGVFDSAQTWLDRTLDLNDEYMSAYVSIFSVYAKRGVWDRFNKRYADIVKMKLERTNPQLSNAIGNAYLSVDSLDKAIQFFTRAKSNDEKYLDPYMGLAEAYARQNIPPMAVENYRRASELKPESAEIHYLLGKTFYKNRQYNEALKEYKETFRLDSSNAAVIYEIADLLYRSRPPYYRDAAIYLRRYMTLTKGNPESYLKYARSLYFGRYYKDAVPVLEQAIKLNPKEFDLIQMLAHSLYESGENKKSVDLYKTIPADSLTYDDYLRIARGYNKLKDTLNAVPAYEKAITMDTASVEFASELGLLYYGLKQYERAAAMYDKKLRADPNNLVALYYGGISFNMAGKPDTAKTYFKRYLEIRPTDLNGLFQLAKTYQLQDSTETTRNIYAGILILLDSLSNEENGKNKEKYTPTMIGVYQILAQMDYKEKDYLSAVENMKKAISYESKDIKKKDENLHLFYAQMLNVARSVKTISPERALEFRGMAIEEYKFVLKLNPKNPAAKKELGQLEGN